MSMIPLQPKRAEEAAHGARSGEVGAPSPQFNTAQAWTRIVQRHAAIMGYKLTIRTPGFIMVGGGIDCLPEPEEQEIIAVRRKWSDCYNALMAACRDHGMRVAIVTYGAAIENWPVPAFSHKDLGDLRIGLMRSERWFDDPDLISIASSDSENRLRAVFLCTGVEKQKPKSVSLTVCEWKTLHLGHRFTSDSRASGRIAVTLCD
jgi:hypothetical protein